MGNRRDSKLLLAVCRCDHAVDALDEAIAALLDAHDCAAKVAQLVTTRRAIETVANDLRKQSRTPAVTEAAK